MALSSPTQHSAFDIWLLLPLARRALWSWSFIVVLLLGVAGTGVGAWKSRPVYQSEAVLLYQDRAGSSPVAMQQDAPSPRRLGLSLQETLFSHALLEKLITEFGLYGKSVARYGIMAGIDEMQKRDLHFNAREGYTFRVSFDSTSPDIAQSVVAHACQLLLKARSEVQAKESKEIQDFLDVEKRHAEEEVRAREAELTLLVAQHPDVIDFGLGRSGALDGSPSDSSSFGFEMQSIQLRERLEQMRRRSTALPDPSQPASAGEISEARLRGQAELAAAQQELAEKQTQFTEQYPDVKRAAMRVATAKAYLRRLEESAAHPKPVAPAVPSAQPAAGSGAESPEITSLKQQLQLLEKQARSARSRGPRPSTIDPKALAGVRTKYIELERRARESREHLALLENRHFQVEMQALFASQDQQGDLVVVDPAFKPVAPLRSPRKKILIGGLLGSLGLALTFGLCLAWKDDRLRSTGDLQRFGLPTLLCEVPPPEAGS
jgi:uncharacterized protein involved in exopolysaccharide biosynthesis